MLISIVPCYSVFKSSKILNLLPCIIICESIFTLDVNQGKHLSSNFLLDTLLFIFMSWFYTLCIELFQFQIVAVMFSANLVCLDTFIYGICRIIIWRESVEENSMV